MAPSGGEIGATPALHVPGPDSFTMDYGRTWVDVDERHILVGRGHDVMWRSTGAYPVASAKDDVYDMLFGPPGIAFQILERGPLYVATGRGREHQVAIGEWPEAWTPAGNLVTIRPGTEQGADWTIALRRADGSLLRILASNLSVRAIDARTADATGWFWFWTAAGNLVRTDGAAAVAVSNYHSLGFDRPPSISLLAGGLVNLFSDDWHVAILHRGGGVFARASAPIDGSVAGFGSQLASPDGRVVVYALARLGGHGTTTIYALHQGDRSGRQIFQGRGVDWVCAFPPMGWRDGRWLLFRRPDGHTVAIDTSGRRPPEPVDARTAHRLFDASASPLTPAA